MTFQKYDKVFFADCWTDFSIGHQITKMAVGVFYTLIIKISEFMWGNVRFAGKTSDPTSGLTLFQTVPSRI